MTIVFLVIGPQPSKLGLIRLLRQLAPGLDFSVMCTTRTARPGEQNGREFSFVSREDFERMIGNDEFLEYTNIRGNYYGTPRLSLEEARQHLHDLLIQVDPIGAAQIKKSVRDVVTIRMAAQPLDAGLTSLKEVPKKKNSGFSIEQTMRDDRYDYLLVSSSPEEAAIKLRQIVVSERLRRGGGLPAADG